MIKKVLIVVFVILSMSCFLENIFVDEDAKLAKELYYAVYKRNVEDVKSLLDEGADPDYCDGEAGWVDSNPLSVIAESFYATYVLIIQGEDVPLPALDIVTFNYLIEAGADIHKRPYIWERIYIYDENNYDIALKNVKREGYTADSEEGQAIISNFMIDCNRLIKAFIEAGADPDMLGHEFPFSYEGMEADINTKEAKEYFSKGSRAINLAIEKGIVWESQVDLLLEYTTLDEESLAAAERSGSDEMITKIYTLWEEQGSH